MSKLATVGKDYDFVFKIVLVGDTCVGKSSILLRFSDDVFSDTYVTTIGVDFWDTAGQERYRSITNAYYREAAAIFVCFDLTNNASFASLKTWLNEVANYTDGDVNKLILANKEDEVSERKVSKEAIDEFMKTTGVEVKEVSAKSGKGVEEAFKYMVQKLITQK